MAKQGINKAIILGNVGQDPEIRYLPDGAAVASLSIATGESWKDKNTGEKQERTEWHRVSAFGKLAEIIGQYVKKGSKLYIEGSIHTRKWQAQDGSDRYTTEIKADQMQMLDSRGQSDNSGYQQGAQPNQNQPNPQGQPQPQGEAFDDDLPF